MPSEQVFAGPRAVAGRRGPGLAALAARWRYPLALLLGIAVAAGVVLALAPHAYLYRDPDSSFYLEAARGVLDGRGLMVSGGWRTLPAVTEPLALWPPGFPLAVAFGSTLTRLDPIAIAPLLSWISWALLPSALLFALRDVLSTRSIFVVAALVMISPGAIDFAWQPMTDMPFLLLVVLSFGLLFRGAGESPDRMLVLLAGLVAGFADSVRNVGVVLPAAVWAAYALLTLLRVVAPRFAIRTVLWWSAGFTAVLLPLLARNLWVSGDLQPYQMDASTLGFVANVRYLAAAAVNDLIALHGLSDRIVWRDATLLALAAGTAGAAWLTRATLISTVRQLPPEARAPCALLLTYAAAAAAIVVIARSRYEWGEVIGLRHLLQLDWIIITAGAVVVESGGRMRRPARGAAVGVVVALVVGLLGLRLSYLAQEVAMVRREHRAAAEAPTLLDLDAVRSAYRYRLAVKLALVRDDALMTHLRRLPQAAVLASNVDDVVRVATARVVLPVDLGPDCDLRKAFPGIGEAPTPVLYVVLAARRDLLASGCWTHLQRADVRRPAGAPARDYVIGLDPGEIRALLARPFR